MFYRGYNPGSSVLSLSEINKSDLHPTAAISSLSPICVKVYHLPKQELSIQIRYVNSIHINYMDLSKTSQCLKKTETAMLQNKAEHLYNQICSDEIKCFWKIPVPTGVCNGIIKSLCSYRSAGKKLLPSSVVAKEKTIQQLITAGFFHPLSASPSLTYGACFMEK